MCATIGCCIRFCQERGMCATFGCCIHFSLPPSDREACARPLVAAYTSLFLRLCRAIERHVRDLWLLHTLLSSSERSRGVCATFGCCIHLSDARRFYCCSIASLSVLYTNHFSRAIHILISSISVTQSASGAPRTVQADRCYHTPHVGCYSSAFPRRFSFNRSYMSYSPRGAALHLNGHECYYIGQSLRR